MDAPIQPLSRSPTAPVGSTGFSAHRPKRVPSLSLDLSGLPPPMLMQPPAAPTNTLLFTNLLHPDVFRPDNLQTLRDLVHQAAPLHSWAPLRSFRRIIASFFSAADAARVRGLWEGESILGEPVQVYYGRTTPLDAGAPGHIQHLALPDAGKLFFISPPPSPPHDWQMRLEGAPNKQVHADDLADALARLHHQAATPVDDLLIDHHNSHNPHNPHAMPSPASSTSASRSATTRSRSSTLVIYQPADHGSHSSLPAIAVEDLTAEPDSFVPPAPIMAHTQRPPVELMNDA